MVVLRVCSLPRMHPRCKEPPLKIGCFRKYESTTDAHGLAIAVAPWRSDFDTNGAVALWEQPTKGNRHWVSAWHPALAGGGPVPLLAGMVRPVALDALAPSHLDLLRRRRSLVVDQLDLIQSRPLLPRHLLPRPRLQTRAPAVPARTPGGGTAPADGRHHPPRSVSTRCH